MVSYLYMLGGGLVASEILSLIPECYLLSSGILQLVAYVFLKMIACCLKANTRDVPMELKIDSII